MLRSKLTDVAQALVTLLLVGILALGAFSLMIIGNALVKEAPADLLTVVLLLCLAAGVVTFFNRLQHPHLK